MLDLDPPLTLRPETAFYILLKAREFDAKVEQVDPNSASNPTDDRDVDVLEFEPGDAAEEELISAVQGLNVDARLDLIALIWIGREDFTLDQWAEARQAAREIDPSEVARYVSAIPIVSDYLEAALSQLGFSLNEYLDSGLHPPGAPELGPSEV